MGLYIVQAGDTGEKIAAAQKPPVPLAELFAANPGVLWESLPVGYHLHIPGLKTTQYEVIPGDNATSIAGRLGIPLRELQNLNAGVDMNKLSPKQLVTVPAQDAERHPLLQNCVGAPITGVPAQMPPPAQSTGTPMSDGVRKKVAGLVGIPEDNVAFKKVIAMDWVGCFWLFLDNAATLTPGAAVSANSQVVAIVDLRNPSHRSDTDHVPWKVPASLSLPCVEGKSNSSIFDQAVQAKNLVLFTDAGRKQLRQVVFVDTHGHGRAPEMAVRYVQWVSAAQAASGGPSPQVFYMSGGLAAYCNAQSFGRILLNTPNPFVTGWPKSL